MSESNDEYDPVSELEYKLIDLEAISDLMINVQADHMSGEDVQKFGGTIWRLHGEIQKAFDAMTHERSHQPGGAS